MRVFSSIARLSVLNYKVISMAQEFRKNQHVRWNHGAHTAHGQIHEVFKEKVTRTIKGSEITRNATEEEPAYLVVQDDGDKALKSQSELQAEKSQ
jgi:hypothetical protein